MNYRARIKPLVMGRCSLNSTTAVVQIAAEVQVALAVLGDQECEG